MNKHGKITPSRFADVMTSGRGSEKWGKTAIAYAQEVALERIGVQRPEVFAYALNWGNEHEEAAIGAFIEDYHLFVEPCNVIQSHELEYVAGTPDGLVSDKFIIEVKCPYNPVNHLANLRNGEQIKDYMYQIQGYLWLTGRKLCYFISYDPRFPEQYQLSVHYVKRDQELIDTLKQRIIDFEAELVQPILEGFICLP